MRYEKRKPRKTATKYWRIFALFGVLAIVAVIAVLAYDSYELYELDDYIGQQDMYIVGSYSGYECEEYYVLPSYSIYNHEYGYDSNEAYQSYDYGGYINTAPSYIEISNFDIDFGSVVTDIDTLRSTINAVPADGITRVIRVAASANPLDFTGAAITIAANQHVHLITYGTDIVAGDGVDARVLLRPAGIGGRHFIVNGANASLTLTNIILDGGRGPADIVGAGGVAVQGGGTFEMRINSVIRHCLDTSAGGGGINVNNNGHFILSGGNVISNRSHVGGGIYMGNQGGNASTITIESGFVRNNFATGTGGNGGGGINVNGGALTIDGGTIAYNHAVGHGGGVRINSSVHPFIMTSGVIRNNETDADGGGVGITNGMPLRRFNMSGDATIQDNTALGLGGGVRGGAAVTMTDNATIRRNTANQGGGVHVGAEGILTIRDSATISSNRANTAGGVNAGSHAYINMHGGAIYNNRQAPSSGAVITQGGGVRMNGAASRFVMTGGTIGHTNPDYANQAQRGGGVFLTAGARFFMEDYTPADGGPIVPGTGTIIGNIAVSANAVTEHRGGGVYISGTGATFTMRAGNIEENTAHTGGGVHLFDGTTFVMTGGTIADNDATSEGGGVAAMGRSTFIMAQGGEESHLTQGTITDNTAVRNGGGVYVSSNAGFHLHAGEISHNITSAITEIATGGGGVFVRGYFEMTDGDIHDNATGMSPIQIVPDTLPIATNRGGGVHVAAGGFFEMEGGTIRNNNTRGMGAGVNVSDSGVFIMWDGQIHDNWARSGAGVYLDGDGAMGTFEMHGGEIFNNRAVGRIDASDNPVDGIGGGVCLLRYANFVMHGGTIRDNYALASGGGVWVGGESTFTLASNAPKAIQGNSAIYNGGGVWLSANAYMVVAFSVTNESVIRITHNTSGEYGGGIFTERYQYNVLNLTDVVAYSNLNFAGQRSIFFEHNSAGNGAFEPPLNAYGWTMIPGYAQGGSQSIYRHPINNYDINWTRTVVPWAFHKANSGVLVATNFEVIEDIEPYLLEGAYFMLFRFVGSGAAPDVAYAGSPNWEVMRTNLRSSGDLNIPISLSLIEGAVYHLVETKAPVGYMTPIGQWRIVADYAAPGGVRISAIGGFAPSFVYLDGYFYVGNSPMIMLPLTGGDGAIAMTAAISGTALICGAILLLIVLNRLKLKRGNKKCSHIRIGK